MSNFIGKCSTNLINRETKYYDNIVTYNHTNLERASIMKMLITGLLLGLSSFASAAHLSKNLRCIAIDGATSVEMKFQVVKANKLHRLTVSFVTPKGGELKAGDKLDFVIDGQIISEVKLRSKDDFLKGTDRIQGFDPDFGIDVDKGSIGEIGGLTCTFKR